jgi:hypothetical protein
MKKIAKGKLHLDRETLVALQSSELDAIAGGQAATITPSAVGCPISVGCTPIVNPIVQKTAEVGRQVGEWGRQVWDRVRTR